MHKHMTSSSYTCAYVPWAYITNTNARFTNIFVFSYNFFHNFLFAFTISIYICARIHRRRAIDATGHLYISIWRVIAGWPAQQHHHRAWQCWIQNIGDSQSTRGCWSIVWTDIYGCQTVRFEQWSIVAGEWSGKFHWLNGHDRETDGRKCWWPFLSIFLEHCWVLDRHIERARSEFGMHNATIAGCLVLDQIPTMLYGMLQDIFAHITETLSSAFFFLSSVYEEEDPP